MLQKKFDIQFPSPKKAQISLVHSQELFKNTLIFFKTQKLIFFCLKMFFVKSGGKEIMIGLGDKVEINKQFCKKDKILRLKY